MCFTSKADNQRTVKIFDQVLGSERVFVSAEIGFAFFKNENLLNRSSSLSTMNLTEVSSNAEKPTML